MNNNPKPGDIIAFRVGETLKPKFPILTPIENPVLLTPEMIAAVFAVGMLLEYNRSGREGGEYAALRSAFASEMSFDRPQAPEPSTAESSRGDVPRTTALRERVQMACGDIDPSPAMVVLIDAIDDLRARLAEMEKR
jgi:hypothetical protein